MTERERAEEEMRWKKREPTKPLRTEISNGSVISICEYAKRYGGTNEKEAPAFPSMYFPYFSLMNSAHQERTHIPLEPLRKGQVFKIYGSRNDCCQSLRLAGQILKYR